MLLYGGFYVFVTKIEQKVKYSHLNKKKKGISFKEKFSIEDILLNNYPFGEILNFHFLKSKIFQIQQ